jgi:hypothetical protein
MEIHNGTICNANEGSNRKDYLNTLFLAENYITLRFSFLLIYLNDKQIDTAREHKYESIGR